MLKLAKHPCHASLKGLRLPCGDRWREVNGRGKNRTITCMVHGHVSKGADADLVRIPASGRKAMNKLTSRMERDLETLTRINQHG